MVGVPDPASLKGWVTRLTPYRLHLLFYRYVVGDESADGDDSAQFPTVLDRSLRPAALNDALVSVGFETIWDLHYEGPVSRFVRDRHRILDVALGMCRVLGRIVRFGRWDVTRSDFLIVARRCN